ncbi:unnamed protein product, partial [Laminaria digitata]
REEGRLSDAWVALWGRRHSQYQGGHQEAVRAAARRCVFLEAFPEQACPEQAPTMKAFVCRNYGEIERARKEATARRAVAWEMMHD